MIPVWVTIGETKRILTYMQLPYVHNDESPLDLENLYTVPKYVTQNIDGKVCCFTDPEQIHDMIEFGSLDDLDHLGIYQCGLIQSAHDFDFKDIWNVISIKSNESAFVFDGEDPQKILNRLEEVDFLKSLTDLVRSKKISLPQVKETISHNFCNESIYANFTLVMINGLVSMS